MESYKRRQVISALLKEAGEVTIEDLAVRLGVSENTVRNDLNAMEAENLLHRVRGGAIARDGDAPLSNGGFASRSRVQQDQCPHPPSLRTQPSIWARWSRFWSHQ